MAKPPNAIHLGDDNRGHLRGMLNAVALTKLEKSLVDHVVRGETLDLAVGLTRAEIDLVTMQAWGDDHKIRASVIRDILRGLHLPTEGADPHGLRLRGATIVGRLDLDGLTTPVSLSLRSSNLLEGLSADNCNIPSLDLVGSIFNVDEEHGDSGAVRLMGATIRGQLGLSGAVLTNRRGPALLADGLNVSGDAFFREGFTATGAGEDGVLRLSGATIQGQLGMRGAVLTNASGPAFSADGLNVGGDAFLDEDFSATGAGERGTVRLSGATIQGQLALSGAVLANESGPALLADLVQVSGGAFLDEGFSATGAGDNGAVRLSGAKIQGQLGMRGAVLTNGSGPALSADGLNVGGDAFLDEDFSATGAGKKGTVRLSGATIEGQLALSGAVLTNESGPALLADLVQVSGGAFLDEGFSATGSGDNGAVRLSGATIQGQLGMRGAVLTNGGGPALAADRLFVGGGAFLDEDFSATGVGDKGTVRLLGATVQGQLVLSGAVLNNESGPALIADGLSVGVGAFLEEGFTATGAGDDGAVRLLGATIQGQLGMRGAVLTNESGPAFSADRLVVGGGAFLHEGFSATGAGDKGAVRLSGATIQGQLGLRSAVLTNESGPALSADGLSVGGDAFLDGSFTATGAGDDGAVRLLGATIQGQLGMRGAVLTNESGPALAADGLNVGSDAFLDRGFSATGAGDKGAVRLSGATIQGQLGMRSAVLSNGGGPALLADLVSVGGGAFLDGSFSAKGVGDGGAVRLSDSRIAGQLHVSSAVVGSAFNDGRWAVDGFVYDGYPSAGFKAWLTFLREGTVSYSPQTYQHLASVARAAGHEADARRVLMAQRDDQVKRGDLPWRSKAWARFTKFTLGYGYQPWRALLLVAANLFLATLITLFVPGALAVESIDSQQDATGTREVVLTEQCTSVQKFQIAVDMAVPLVSTSQNSPCAITSTYAGQAVSWFGVFFTFAGWALTALFAAGFTRAIRQP